MINLRTLVAAAAIGLLVASASQGANVVARYVLDGDVLDSGPNSYNGVADPNISFVNDPDRGLVASFDGSSGVNVSASSYSITERPNFQFAISFWIKPDFIDVNDNTVADVNVVMGAIGSGVIEIVGDGSWHGMGGSSAYGGVGVNSGGGAGSTGKVPAVEGVGGVDLYDGDWHHVVIQWVDPDGTYEGNDAAHAEVWLDNQVATNYGAKYNGNSGNPTPTMVLGGPVVWSNGGAANKYYTGLLSDVYFFDDQLTAQDVDDLYNASGALIGDADGNGVVDAADYIILKTNMGLGSGATTADGDFDGDGKVDWNDLQLLRDHYGEGSAASGVIPEPATLGLLAVGAIALLRRNRRS